MLGSCPMDECTSRGEKIVFIICALTVYALHSSCAVSTTVFILKHVSSNLEDTLYALLQIAGLTYVLYTLIVAFILRHKVNHIFLTQSNIYGECKCESKSLVWVFKYFD